MAGMRILLDAREFSERQTGIGRFLGGLVDSLAEGPLSVEMVLAIHRIANIPDKLKNRKNIHTLQLPEFLLKSEWVISEYSQRGFDLLISPYPKLPLFGCSCKAVHTIHDVIDLTHPYYNKRYRNLFDRFRLKMALNKASLTWYVSEWSMKRTEEFIGMVGRNPRVRYNGISTKFDPSAEREDGSRRRKYGLDQDYILVIGNGKPHKNAGILLDISSKVKQQIVFVGVSAKWQHYWNIKYPKAWAEWIELVADEDLPAVIRGAFCLAHPSTEEGYGYPPLEAMASGIPAVVSNIPVLAETTGGNVLFADPAVPKEWLMALNALADENIYSAYSEKGLKWVERIQGKRGWQKHISDIEEIIQANTN